MVFSYGLADSLLDRVIAIAYLRQNGSKDGKKMHSVPLPTQQQDSHNNKSTSESESNPNPLFDAELSIESISHSHYTDIKDVSLVNGLLKLSNFCEYDRSNCSDLKGISRSNLIMGVRGIYFEKIGKLSLFRIFQIKTVVFH